jgi:hypothetical protein
MAGAEHAVTFVVRLVQSGDGGVHGTVERVKTGRKLQIRAVEDIARVIAAMAREELSASDGGDEGDGS